MYSRIPAAQIPVHIFRLTQATCCNSMHSGRKGGGTFCAAPAAIQVYTYMCISHIALNIAASEPGHCICFRLQNACC